MGLNASSYLLETTNGTHLIRGIRQIKLDQQITPT